MKGVVLLGMLMALPAQTHSPSWPQMVEGTPSWPSLARTRAAAREAMRLVSDDEVESWARRARDRAWLPRLDVRFGTRGDQDVRSLGTASESWAEGRDFGVDLALRWGLRDLVFSDVELRAHREQLARSVALQRRIESVTKAYFQRLEVELAEPSAERTQAMARLDGTLDALTAGAWTRGDLLR